MNLKAQWQAWGQRIALLSQRERVLILLTGLVLLGAAGIYGWLEGADARLQQDRMALSAAERDLEIMELENLGKQARLKRDPNQGVRDQLAQVEADLARIDGELKAQTVDLIPAHEMPLVLEALLSRSANLHMLALSSLEPTPLMAGEQRSISTNTVSGFSLKAAISMCINILKHWKPCRATSTGSSSIIRSKPIPARWWRWRSTP